MTTPLLLVGHGSRDPVSNAEFEAAVEQYRARRPDLDLRYGYVELARPPFAKVLREMAAEHERILLAPFMLFASGHVKNDLPLALADARKKFPRLQATAAWPLGVDPSLAQLAFDRCGEVEPSKTAVVFVGRGSSDPDANGDFFKMARLFQEGRGFASLTPCFMGITTPKVAETLEFVARSKPDRILVVPYLLFSGVLIDKLKAQVEAFSKRYPWLQARVADPLGAHEAVFALLDRRMKEAGVAPLPCDACQYRLPLPGFEGQVGGLKALLWSLRHSYTHTQSMPHVHAHKPLRKHVLVCTNVDCSDRGSAALVENLRRGIKACGRERDIRVTRTSCLGRCGEGPNVAVYPDGVWYRQVKAEDSDALVQEHLLGDRLVGRLVDHVMQ